MTKLADAIHFDYIEELCEEILDRLNEDDEAFISVIGKYDDIRNFIKEFMTYDEVNFDCLDICNPKCNDYTSEYIVDIWTSDGTIIFDCEPAKVYDEYDYYKGDVLYMLDGTKQALADNCEYDEKYFVIIGEEDSRYEDCACECSKDEDGGYTIKVKCNLDADEAMKIIDKMEARLLEVNKIFKEMNNMKNLLGF